MLTALIFLRVFVANLASFLETRWLKKAQKKVSGVLKKIKSIHVYFLREYESTNGLITFFKNHVWEKSGF